jgi:hypothetical protein
VLRSRFSDGGPECFLGAQRSYAGIGNLYAAAAAAKVLAK